MPNGVPNEALLTGDERDVIREKAERESVHPPGRMASQEEVEIAVTEAAAAKAYAVGLRDGEAKPMREVRALVKAWKKEQP